MSIEKKFKLGPEDAGKRLDVVLAGHLPITRSAVLKLLKEDRVMLGLEPAKASHITTGGEVIEIIADSPEPKLKAPKLKVLYEDSDMVIVDKPAGLNVHNPETGRNAATVADFATTINRDDPDRSRPGIVHRLDKDTSGLLIIAKHMAAKTYLQELFAKRLVKKTYTALVEGRVIPEEAIIKLPIGRSRQRPVKRAVIPGGRESATKYRVIRQLPAASLVELEPATGRTHQIRVHLAHIGHPVVGDKLYGRPGKLPKLSRQFLHASSLNFTGYGGKQISVQSTLTADLADYLKQLQPRV
ncbi:MAG TPA: RluA family pseudouridine synthase [Candidatus Dormibacteraeota bacterium]|nr:RluA family pseudouridine synthase [Candidatus Dormibacteraeota bacterium]